MIGDTLWAWQEIDEHGWGIIAAIVPAVSVAPVPLVSRSEDVAKTLFQHVAERHAQASGHGIRLARFELAEVAE